MADKNLINYFRSVRSSGDHCTSVVSICLDESNDSKIIVSKFRIQVCLPTCQTTFGVTIDEVSVATYDPFMFRITDRRLQFDGSMH